MTSARHRQALEDRATAWAQVQDIQNRRSREGYQDSEEDGATYTRALDDVERLSRIVEEEERSARLDIVMNTPAEDLRGTTPQATAGDPDGGAAYREAFTGYLRRGMAGATPEEVRMLQSGFVAEERAQGTSTGAAGGYTVPPEFLNRMVEAQRAFGGIAQHAEVITTDSGAALPWPTNDDTSNVGAILDQNTQMGEQDLTFGQGSIGAYTYTSKIVRVAIQLLQDAGFNVETWLPTKLGARIGRAAAAHYASGTGTAQPQGLAVGLTRSVTSAASGAIGFDDLVELEHSIDPAYRSERARFICHDDVVKSLRKVKDSTGRPVWQPSYVAGAPSTINGRPYIVDNGLAALAAGSKSIVYGDIELAYLIRMVRGAQTMRLTERYADYLQVGFLGFQRLDAKVQDTSAAAVLTTKV
ncbi:phage major capsid protein [Cellulomonas soli]|uniref:phage major capsid protein n=1 Tax=Cellulomonas soli TaxID=931535 RepID=UPI003F85C6BA